MTSSVQWRCRILLGLVLLDLVLGSPVVKRQVVESLGQIENEGPVAVEGNSQQIQLSEDTFGPNLQERGEREKRLFKLKTLGIGALGVKAAKAVGAKAVAAGAAAIKSKIIKAGAAAKAVAVGTVGLKAKAIGAKALTAIAALGIKTLLFNLLFGKINKLIDYKERLLSDLDHMNRVQNEAFNTNFYDIPKIPIPVPVKTIFRGSASSSSTPKRPDVSTATANDDIPEFDPNKISLQIPDQFFAPAFNSLNSIAIIAGEVIQNTAERLARLVEGIKPLFRTKLGISASRGFKRQTAEIQDNLADSNDQVTNEADTSVESQIKNSYIAIANQR